MLQCTYFYHYLTSGAQLLSARVSDSRLREPRFELRTLGVLAHSIFLPFTQLLENLAIDSGDHLYANN